MAQYNEQWAICLTDLLTEHGCATGRLAEKYTNGALSHGYISRMMVDGLLPPWATATEFLSHFDRKGAIKCLQAAGYPIPQDWQPEDPVEATVMFLRSLPGVSEPCRQDLLTEVKKTFTKHAKKKKKNAR